MAPGDIYQQTIIGPMIIIGNGGEAYIGTIMLHCAVHRRVVFGNL